MSHHNAEQALLELDIHLPTVNPPVANYLPYCITGDLIYISGQTCKWNGQLQYLGQVGKSISLRNAHLAAELAGKNLLLQLKQAVGSLNHVSRCVKLTIFINSSDEFTDHPYVADGVSSLMVSVFGESGQHARAAVGASSLPGNATVEVDAVFQLCSELKS